MPHEYPPRITNDTFAVANPPSGDVVGACQESQQQAGVAALRLHGDQFAGFNGQVDIDLNPVDAGRIRFAPNVDQLTIDWAFDGHAHIITARLEIFAAGVAGAVWIHPFNWANANDRQANGNVVIIGATSNNGPNQEFPNGFLTVTRAPYQICLTITEVEPQTEVTSKRRWLYLDVVIDHIDLALGARDLMPVQDPFAPVDRYFRLNAAMYDGVRAQLTLPNQAEPELLTSQQAPANVELRLVTNIFSRSENDFDDNTIFKAMRDVWLDDPMLPLIASVYVKRHDAQPAPLADGAAALGGLELLWDWAGADCTLQNARPRPTNFVANALRYKPDVWPKAGGTCHADHGGKRGGNASMFDPIQPAANVHLFPTIATQNRPWALFSNVVSDPNHAYAGKTGVLFRPSLIAGDAYQLTVYPTLPNRATLDRAQASAFDRVVANLPAARATSVLTVWKIITVARHWSKHQTPDSARLDWQAVNAFFAHANVRLVPPAEVSLIDAVNAADYRQAFTRIKQADGFLPAHSCVIDWTADQCNGDFGFTRNTYDEFKIDVEIHVSLLRAHVAQANPQDQQGVFNAQLPMLGNALSPLHLYLDQPSHATAKPEVLRRHVQARLGIKDTDTYSEVASEWGGDILSRVVSDFQRTVTPDTPGLHLFEFQFADNTFVRPDVAEAATTISNRMNCWSCQNPLPTKTPQEWSDAALTANRICSNCHADQNGDATIISYVPFRYIDAVSDQWAEDNLRLKDRLVLKIAAQYHPSANIAIAHEIGHQLGLPHAPPKSPKVLLFVPTKKTGGIKFEFHDETDEKCIMSYNIAYADELHFCGVCVLRLRGWSAGPSTSQLLKGVDGKTVLLSKVSLQNTGIESVNGAQWLPTAGVDACPICHQAFSMVKHKHHCRRCGQVICSACSSKEIPVRNPISEDGGQANPIVKNARVCDTCYGVWMQPD